MFKLVSKSLAIWKTLSWRIVSYLELLFNLILHFLDSACRDEIQQVEDSQIRLNNKFASMSDFNAIPLSLRTDCL